METIVIKPSWQALYEKSFPADNISNSIDIPKIDRPNSNAQYGGVNPWVVIGLVAAAAGVTIYIFWRLDQDAKMRNQAG